MESKTFLVFFFHTPIIFTLDPAVIKVSTLNYRVNFNLK